MIKEKTRAFLFLFAGLIVLCLVWSFVLQTETTSAFNVYMYYLKVLVLYIPLSIATVGTVFGFASLFLTQKYKKFFRTFSITTIFIAALITVIGIGTIATNSIKEETSQQLTIANQKFQIENIISETDLSLRQETNALIEEPNCYSLGSFFAYQNIQHYVGVQDEMLSIEMEVYELQNVPWIFQHKIRKELEQTYFYEPTKVGDQYIYFFEEEKGRVCNISQLYVLIQKDNDFTLVMLYSSYIQKNPINIEKVLAVWC